MEFYKLRAKEIAEGVRCKKWTASEVLEAQLERIKKYDAKINAVVTLCEAKARKEAAEVDAKIARGENPGLLAGVPYLAKDNFCADGVKTTCCSKMLENWVPDYDATVTKLMREAGAVLMGKTNMDEFAMGSTTESSIFGPTLNPRDISRVPGGSSGGCAASVAAGYCPIALGSDTGGSVRQPAAFCGVQGYKPSYGQISRFGIVGYVSSLDQVGPIARNTEDIALVMNVLAKGDYFDSTCDAYDRPSFTQGLENASLKGKKIAVLSGYDKAHIDPELLDAIDKTVEYCKSEGAEVFEVDLAVAKKHAVACYYMVALGDASSKMACYDGMRYGYHEDGKNLTDMYKQTRNNGFGREVRHRILIGTCILSRGYFDNYYVPATRVRQMIADEFTELFKNADACICPIHPRLPYKQGYVDDNALRVYLGDAFSSISNLAGLPSMSLNTGFTPQGLPTYVQLIGPRFADDKLLALAFAIEKGFGKPQVASMEGVC